MKRYSCLFMSMPEIKCRLLASSVLSRSSLIGAVSLLAVSAQVASVQAAEPMLLTDNELDGITAGFLEVNAAADAVALGRNTVTDTFTSTDVLQGLPQADGYAYSKGSALAEALAIGESVATHTEVGFTTNEEVVSVQFENAVETSIVGYVKPKDKKAWNQRKRTADRKTRNQPNRKKDKKAWHNKGRNNDPDKKAWHNKGRKNDPNKKAWHKKDRRNDRNKKTRHKKDRRNDPNKKAWHKKDHRNDPNKKAWHNKGRKNDPNRKAWRKTPIIQQRKVSTLVVVTRVSVAPTVPVVTVPVLAE